MTETLRLLVLASRPSDFTEMSALARALAARGHRPHLYYFYSPEEPGHQRVLAAMADLAPAGVSAQAVNVNDARQWTRRSAAPVEPPATADQPAALFTRTSRAAEVGLYALVMRVRDRVLGREAATALARRFPLVRRVFPAIYVAARGIDVIRNLPAAYRLSKRAVAAERSAGRPPALHQRAALLWEAARVIPDMTDLEQIYWRFYDFVADAIAEAGADALLVPEDIVGNLWPVAIRAGHEAGVPTVVLPYTLANQEEAVQGLRHDRHVQTSRNRIAAILFPAWRLERDDVDVVRLPSPHIFSHEAMGITPPDPWMMNSGYADLIAVDSQASYDYFRTGGIPADQLRVVGSPSQDEMFRQRETRAASLESLRRDLGLDGRRPLLLVSGCPNQLAGSVPHCDFATMEEVARHVGRSLAPLGDDYHLVVRPHPNYPEFGKMLEPFGFVTTMMPTASLVPLADLFVAFASATIRWAIACGVPAVNYDVFHYGYADFAETRAVRTVTGGAEFRDLVRSLTPDGTVMREWSATAAADRAYWSVMDGRSLERIEAEIHAARRRRRQMTKEQAQHE